MESTDRFRLQLIGYPTLWAPTGEPVELRSRKHLALLAVLAVERRRAFSKDWLADLLWERVDSEASHHSLACAITELRRILGKEAIVTRRPTVEFGRDRLAIDLDDLADLGAPLEVDAFFGDWSVGDAPNFERWREGIQADLLPRLLHRGLLQLREAREAGSLWRTAEIAGRVLRVHEFSEEGICARMETLAAVGDRWAALAAFEKWCEKVREELGREPPPAVAATMTRLLQDSRSHRFLLPEVAVV